ncbi:MAG: hypothetical protein ACYDCO_25585 [Armatimonadota bacterium]
MLDWDTLLTRLAAFAGLALGIINLGYLLWRDRVRLRVTDILQPLREVTSQQLSTTHVYLMLRITNHSAFPVTVLEIVLHARRGRREVIEPLRKALSCERNSVDARDIRDMTFYPQELQEWVARIDDLRGITIQAEVVPAVSAARRSRNLLDQIRVVLQ